MSLVRVGAVEYLNARPLVYGLDRSSRFSLRFDVPSLCASLLHAGNIDLGLIPSIQYLRAPSSDDYRIVPDVGITSRGAVASVTLFTTRPIRDVRSIALDTSSRTSVALVKVFCARVFRMAPTFVDAPPDLDRMLSSADAALLIGDTALVLDLTAAFDGRPDALRHTGHRDIEKIDLGQLWTDTTGLPFVYAFWAGRAGVLGPEHVAELKGAKETGVQKATEIAEAYFSTRPEHRSLGARYLRDNIKYTLGADERAGLELFYTYAVEAGVAARKRALQFY